MIKDKKVNPYFKLTKTKNEKDEIFYNIQQPETPSFRLSTNFKDYWYISSFDDYRVYLFGKKANDYYKYGGLCIADYSINIDRRLRDWVTDGSNAQEFSHYLYAKTGIDYDYGTLDYKYYNNHFEDLKEYFYANYSKDDSWKYCEIPEQVNNFDKQIEKNLYKIACARFPDDILTKELNGNNLSRTTPVKDYCGDDKVEQYNGTYDKSVDLSSIVLKEFKMSLFNEVRFSKIFNL